MSVARLSTKDTNSEPKKARVDIQSALIFLNEDEIGTIQPHDDALVVTLRIGGYNVKRVMVDQGSGAKIMPSELGWRSPWHIVEIGVHSILSLSL